MTLKKQGLARAENNAPIIATEGDGVNRTLHEIKQKYDRKAAYLGALGVRPARNGMYYENASAAVGALLA
jgi:hypothetical protein